MKDAHKTHDTTQHITGAKGLVYSAPRGANEGNGTGVKVGGEGLVIGNGRETHGWRVAGDERRLDKRHRAEMGTVTTAGGENYRENPVTFTVNKLII